MSNYFYGMVLILLSILPSFQGKTEIENRAKQKIYNPSEKSYSKNDINMDISNVPEKIDPLGQISLGSDSAVFVDLDSGKILYEKDKDKKLAMASTTKLMTALIAYENLKMDEAVTVPKITVQPLDSVMGISTGQKFKVSELMHGLLIESGSDAAQTLAIAAAGDENGFVAMMNEKAALLGLTNTQFTNVVGYDDNGHFSSAYDLAKLAKVFIKNKTLSEIASKSKYIATSETGQNISLSNTNQLLNEVNYKGLKTGTTFAAGECLVSYYETGDQKIIGVVLNSPSRFFETNKAIEWSKGTFTWQ